MLVIKSLFPIRFNNCFSIQVFREVLNKMLCCSPDLRCVIQPQELEAFARNLGRLAFPINKPFNVLSQTVSLSRPIFRTGIYGNITFDFSHDIRRR